jgi:hypothetical protein
VLLKCKRNEAHIVDDGIRKISITFNGQWSIFSLARERGKKGKRFFRDSRRLRNSARKDGREECLLLSMRYCNKMRYRRARNIPSPTSESVK